MTPEELQRGINSKRTEIQMNHAFRKFTIREKDRERKRRGLTLEEYEAIEMEGSAGNL
jgi:hypothetical protein